MHCSLACLFVSCALALPLGAQEGAGKTGPAPVAASTQQPEPRLRQRPADQKALFTLFAKTPGFEAAYEEEKQLALLAVPLKSSGRLLFLPPGYLARMVETPEKSTLRITPDELRVADRDGTEVIDLKKSDKLRVFVTSLVQVFAGNEAVLQKSFTVEYALDAKNERAWTLVLKPKGKPLDQMLKALSLHGEGEAVTRIEVEDPNGDRTVTRIVKADAARKFSADEQQRWFGIEPK
jgi:outer membrane lipoprotein-sorting protein